MDYLIISPQKIEDLMFNEGEYIIEFCEAGLTSYEEFRGNFVKHLQSRNLEGLKQAGHKIKPGLKMMGAELMLDEYENAKKLLESDAGDEEINTSIQKMSGFCETAKKELQYLAEQY